ncbi:MAG: sugar phosphate isomerase/epimerase [Thermodesulfovibrionales bacterium]|nr:sugar phosphate isomerase/epimerase [Thermodesulfovibrionales bacterium]
MLKPQVRVPYDLLDDYLSAIIEHKLDIELYLSGSILDSMKPGDAALILEKLTHSPRMTIHAPFMDLNPGAVDSRVLEATRARFHQAFDVAEVLRPVNIVLHSGYEKWKYDHDIDLWLQSSLSFWPEFIQRAEAIDTRLAIENIFEDEPESLALLMKSLDNPMVGICFDAGHCNIFTKVPMSRWLDVLGPYIIETHLHDNNGDLDSHLALGEGNIDFHAVMAALSEAGQDVVHTIETLTAEDTFKSMKTLQAIHQSVSS